MNFRDAAGRQFTAENAAKELTAYRKGRLGPTTRLMRDSVVDLGLSFRLTRRRMTVMWAIDVFQRSASGYLLIVCRAWTGEIWARSE